AVLTNRDRGRCRHEIGTTVHSPRPGLDQPATLRQVSPPVGFAQGSLNSEPPDPEHTNRVRRFLYCDQVRHDIANGRGEFEAVTREPGGDRDISVFRVQVQDEVAVRGWRGNADRNSPPRPARLSEEIPQ